MEFTGGCNFFDLCRKKERLLEGNYYSYTWIKVYAHLKK